MCKQKKPSTLHICIDGMTKKLLLVRKKRSGIIIKKTENNMIWRRGKRAWIPWTKCFFQRTCRLKIPRFFPILQFLPCFFLPIQRMSLMRVWLRQSHVRMMAPFLVKMATLSLAPVAPLELSSPLSEYISSFIPGTRTAGSFSRPRRPWIDGRMELSNAPCMGMDDIRDMSVSFHCSPTPDMPEPESKIIFAGTCWAAAMMMFWQA